MKYQPLFTLITILAVIGLFLPASVEANADDSKLATMAKSFVSKKDTKAKAIGQSSPFQAVKEIALAARVIDQQTYNQTQQKTFLAPANTNKSSNLKSIPAGKVIVFYQNKQVKHVMISAGAGYAYGTQNHSMIGVGKDNVWEKVSLSTFRYQEKNVSIPGFKGPNGKIYEIAWRSITEEKPTLPKQSTSTSTNTNKQVQWFAQSAIENAQYQYTKHKEDFPEIHSAAEYAQLANSIIDKQRPAILRERINGELYVYDRQRNILVIASPKNLPIEMFKPVDGIAYYNYITGSSKLPVSQINENYDIIPQRNAQSTNQPTNEYESVDHTFEQPAQESEYETVNQHTRAINNQDQPASSIKTRSIAPDEDYSLVSTLSTADWARKGQTDGPRNAVLQYRTNKADFKRGITLIQYIAVAHKFYQAPPTGTHKELIANGDVVQYHDATNMFAVYDPDGMPKTLSKPKLKKQAFDNYIAKN